MTRLNTLIKSMQLNRIVAVFVAGCLLWLTAACGRPDTTQLSEGGSYNERKGEFTELYDPIQKKVGGMNQYEDTDPRNDTSGAERKAQRLVDRARSNTRQVNNPDDFARSYQQGTPLNERAKNLAKDVGQSVQEVTEDVSEGTQRGLRNLKNNASNAKDEVGRAGDRTLDQVSDGTQKGIRNLRDTAQNTADRLNDTADRVVNPS